MLVGAEPHDPLDAGAVVPAAVEQRHLAGGREVRDVALEVVLAAFALGGGRQGHHAHHAWAETGRDALDDAALACGVAALEDDHDLEAPLLDPLLELDQLELELAEGLLEHLALHRTGCLGRPIARVGRRGVLRLAAPVIRAMIVAPSALVPFQILLAHGSS